MNMQNFYTQIDSFFASKDFQGAEQFMKATLAQAEDEQDPGAMITVCNELGGFYRAFSRYQEGIPLYQKALHCLAQIKMEGSDAHATTLLNFATTLAIVGNDKEALEAYHRAAEIFSSPSYAKDYRLATLYNNMSSLYQNLQQLDEAKEYLLKAMNILQQLSESEIEIAITWSNLAGVYLAMGNDYLEDARKAAEQAVKLFNETSGDKDVHYAAAVTVLGDVCHREKKYHEAASLFQKAMELTARDYGKETLGYAILCENLSQTLTAIASSIKERIKA